MNIYKLVIYELNITTVTYQLLFLPLNLFKKCNGLDSE